MFAETAIESLRTIYLAEIPWRGSDMMAEEHAVKAALELVEGLEGGT
jgi:hypothetical protein